MLICDGCLVVSDDALLSMVTAIRRVITGSLQVY